MLAGSAYRGAGMIDGVFVCPLCGGGLAYEESRLLCPNGHSFDVSASGYVNLLRPGKLRNRSSGDDKKMVAARTKFLSAGYYEKNRDMLISTVKRHASGGGIAVDAGCGEGYYTNAVNVFCPEFKVIGIDASKYACEAASKQAKRLGTANNVAYAVASLAEMPLADDTAELVVSLFSPCAYNEFARILKRGGKVIIASSGKKHLYELKKILYGEENARDNELLDHAARAEGMGFVQVDKNTVSYTTTVEGKDAIFELFSMTPYYWRTPKSGVEALKKVDSLTLTVEVDYTVLELQ